jgi:hypothetical protein
MSGMSIEDMFVMRALAAENELDALADNEAHDFAREDAIRQVQSAYDRYAADGVLDDSEIDRLVASLEKLGVDASAVREMFDRSAAGHGGRIDLADNPRLESLIARTFDDALSQSKDSIGSVSLRMQMGLSEYTESYEAASGMKKTLNDAYMNVIKNIA